MRRLGFLLLLALAGCRACDDHPYVPYAISDGAPTPAIDGAATVDASIATNVANGDAGVLTAAPGATTWDLLGATLTAPPDHVFVFATTLGTADAGDVLAIVAPKDSPGPLDALDFRVRAKQADAPRVLFSTKAAVSDASCAPNARFDDAGSGALSVLLAFTCAGHAPTASRALALVTKSDGGLNARFAVKIRDSENDPALETRVEYADVDHDGVADVTLVASIEGAPAKFVFVDRSAGLSRQAGEPEASFAALAKTASAELEKKDAKGAIATTRNLRAIYRALCHEPARITPLAGVSSLACVPSSAMRKATLTNARALAMDGERLRALFELDVASRLGEKGDLKILAPYVDSISMREKKPFDGTFEKMPVGVPSYSPLVFDADGVLFATGDSVRCLDGNCPSAPRAPWSLAVASPDATTRIIAAYDPCDDANVRVTFAGATSMDDVVLPIEPLMGRKCEDTKGVPVSVAPVTWTPDGASLFVLGQYVQFTSEKIATTSPRPKVLGSSPGGAAAGAFVIVKTPLGIALDDGKKAHLLRDADQKPLDGNRCVVAKSGTRVACIEGDRAVLYSL